MEKEELHFVAVTGIINRQGKYLIVKRSPNQAAFPCFWTVPGGKLRKSDYLHSPKDTPDSWYNVLEKVLKREIKEEVGLKVRDIRYLLNLIYIRSDGIPTIVMSFYCIYESGQVKLSDELQEYSWVAIDELGKYEFISGIREEIELADEALKRGRQSTWAGKYTNPLDQALRDGRLN